MDMEILVQDNRITTARYELSVMEKRIMYILIRDIRKNYISEKIGDKVIYNDLIISTHSRHVLKELNESNTIRVKEAFKSLRLRSFEWDNGLDESDPQHKWFEVGFINYGEWNEGGEIEFQVSKKIIPYFVELTKQYTEYNLIVAMSLKSKWSQRLYEVIGQWKNAGGVLLDVEDLKTRFGLTDKYKKFGAFKKYVLDVAQKELKTLYKCGQCDMYFEYTMIKNGRTVESLRLKIIQKSKNTITASKDDIVNLVRDSLYNIFDVNRKQKNKITITKLMSHLIINAELLNDVYKKIEYTKTNIPKSEWQKYLRYIFNTEYNLKDL